MKSPKVSVIVPIYNASKYLATCLDSIINQTHSNLEIILIDDGSTDDSAKIIQRYLKQDRRIKSFHQTNQGQSTARNVGLKRATGQFISFVDADDAIKPTFIATLLDAYLQNPKTSLAVSALQYNRLAQHTSSDVYTDPPRLQGTHESQKTYILRLLVYDGRLYNCTNKLYLAPIAQKCHFDPKLNFAEDTRFVLDYLSRSHGDIAFILEPLFIYNFGTETSTIRTSATKWSNWQSFYCYLKQWVGPHPSPRERFWLLLVHLRWCVSFVRSRYRAKRQSVVK